MRAGDWCFRSYQRIDPYRRAILARDLRTVRVETRLSHVFVIEYATALSRPEGIDTAFLVIPPICVQRCTLLMKETE